MLVRGSILLLLSLFAERKGPDSRTVCGRLCVKSIVCSCVNMSTRHFQGKDSHWSWFIYYCHPGGRPSPTPTLQSRPPFFGHKNCIIFVSGTELPVGKVGTINNLLDSGLAKTEGNSRIWYKHFQVT